MSKDRKYIACGVPRNRSLIPVEESFDQRLLHYQTKKKAELGYRMSGFYGQIDILKEAGFDWSDDLSNILEPVQAKITVETL